MTFAERVDPRTGLRKRFEYFGSPPNLKLGRLLLPASPSSGVLIAGPIDADRALRPQIEEVSASLAGSGHVVARFDYRGQGQSLGEPGDLTLELMAEDVSEAAKWIREVAAVEHLAMLGVGLGATAAALASGANGLAMAIWDPVIDFQSFVHGLARNKVAVEMGFVGDGGFHDGKLLADVVADDLIDDEIRGSGFFDAGGHAVGSALIRSAGNQLRSDLLARSADTMVIQSAPSNALALDTAGWLNKCLESHEHHDH